MSRDWIAKARNAILFADDEVEENTAENPGDDNTRPGSPKNAVLPHEDTQSTGINITDDRDEEPDPAPPSRSMIRLPLSWSAMVIILGVLAALAITVFKSSSTHRDSYGIDYCARIQGSTEIWTKFSLPLPPDEHIPPQLLTDLHSKIVDDCLQRHSNVASDVKSRLRSLQQYHAALEKLLCHPKTAYVETFLDMVAGILEQLNGFEAQIKSLAGSYVDVGGVYDNISIKADEALDRARLNNAQRMYIDGEPWLARFLAFDAERRWYEPFKATEIETGEVHRRRVALNNEIKRLNQMLHLIGEMKPKLHDLYASVKQWDIFGGLFAITQREPHQTITSTLEQWYNDEIQQILGELASLMRDGGNDYDQEL